MTRWRSLGNMTLEIRTNPSATLGVSDDDSPKNAQAPSVRASGMGRMEDCGIRDAMCVSMCASMCVVQCWVRGLFGQGSVQSSSCQCWVLSVFGQCCVRSLFGQGWVQSSSCECWVRGNVGSRLGAVFFPSMLWSE